MGNGQVRGAAAVKGSEGRQRALGENTVVELGLRLRGESLQALFSLMNDI